MLVHLLVARGVHFKTNLADLTQPSESWDNLVYLSGDRLLFKGLLVWRMWPVWPLPFDSVLQARMMSWPSTSQLGASWWLTWHQFSALIAWLSNSFVFALSILQNATTIKSVSWKENDSSWCCVSMGTESIDPCCLVKTTVERECFWGSFFLWNMAGRKLVLPSAALFALSSSNTSVENEQFLKIKSSYRS